MRIPKSVDLHGRVRVPQALFDRMSEVVELGRRVFDYYRTHVGVAPREPVRLELYSDGPVVHFGRKASWGPRAGHHKIKVMCGVPFRETWMAVPERFYRELGRPPGMRKAAGGGWSNIVAAYDSLCEDDVATLSIAHSAVHVSLIDATTRLWIHEGLALRVGFRAAEKLGVSAVDVIRGGIAACADLPCDTGLFGLRSYRAFAEHDGPQREGLSFHGAAMRLVDRLAEVSREDAAEVLTRELWSKRGWFHRSDRTQDGLVARIVGAKLGKRAAGVLAEAGGSA